MLQVSSMTEYAKPSIPRALVTRIEASPHVKDLGYTSASSFITDAARRRLEEVEKGAA